MILPASLPGKLCPGPRSKECPVRTACSLGRGPGSFAVTQAKYTNAHYLSPLTYLSVLVSDRRSYIIWGYQGKMKRKSRAIYSQIDNFSRVATGYQSKTCPSLRAWFLLSAIFLPRALTRELPPPPPYPTLLAP